MIKHHAYRPHIFVKDIIRIILCPEQQLMILGLDHVDDESNVMAPFSKGRIITGSQISESYTHYNRGQLNQNIPYIKIREERRRKAMKIPK